MAQNETTGGEALVRMLMAHEAGPMFGMGGFQLLPFYDAARRLGLQHNLINDERCAVFAADAYAKVSGRSWVGRCDAGTRCDELGDRLSGGAECRFASYRTHR